MMQNMQKIIFKATMDRPYTFLIKLLASCQKKIKILIPDSLIFYDGTAIYNFYNNKDEEISYTKADNNGFLVTEIRNLIIEKEKRFYQK